MVKPSKSKMSDTLSSCPNPNVLEDDTITLSKADREDQDMLHPGETVDSDILGEVEFTQAPDEVLDMNDTAEASSDIYQIAMDGTATDVLTGGVTPDGMSQDMTAANFGGGRHLGGATGGDVYGAGAGPAIGDVHPISSEEEPLHSNVNTGLSQQITSENTEALINEEQVSKHS